MQKIYWHRKFLSRYIILFLSIFMIVSLYLVENNMVMETTGYTQKKEAAQIADNGFRLTQDFFISKGYLCRNTGDISCTGLIGLSMTDTTTDSGDLYAKRSSVNPNLAAIFVMWLNSLNLQKGDTVALQETGSYPALDIAMLSAIKSLELKPLIIFSAGSSQFGANRPEFTWPDMYKNLVNKKLFNYDVLGITIGGSRDNGYGLNPSAIVDLHSAISRNGYKTINVPYKDATNTSVKKRMAMYKKAAGDSPIKAYINVGGNMASIGLKKNIVITTDSKGKEHKEVSNARTVRSFPSGVVSKLPPQYKTINSVAVQFLQQGVPVVNIRDINSSIIKRYGITYNPASVATPGKGPAFKQKKYNTTLAVILLLIDIALLTGAAILSRKYLISYKTK